MSSLALSTSKTNYLKIFSWAFLIATPFLLLLLFSLLVNNNVLNTRPIVSDEIMYWREAFSFANHGANTGSFGFLENVPKIGNFGGHGFSITLIYSLFAKLFGWNFNSIMICNNILMSASFALLVILLKPKAKTTIFASIAYLTFSPIVVYCASSMSEILNCALLTVFVAFFCLFLKDKSKFKFFLVCVAIFFCCLVRISYIVLFLPVIFIFFNFKFSKKLFLALSVWLVGSVGLYLFISAITSPFPWGFLDNLFNAANVGEMISDFIYHAYQNIILFFSIEARNWNHIMLRYLVVIVMLLSLFFSFLQIKKRNAKYSICKRQHVDAIMLTSFIILFSTFAINILFYDISLYRDYRTFAPCLWVVVILMILQERKHFNVLMSTMQIAFLIITLTHLPSEATVPERFSTEITPIQQSQIELAAHVTPDLNQMSRTENTIVVDIYDQDFLLNLPSEIGIQYVSYESDYSDYKSKYVLVTNDKIIQNYKVIAENDYGKLYIKE